MDEREARLQRVRVNQQHGIDSESTDEREARLQRVQVNQQRRIATASSEERERPDFNDYGLDSKED